MKRVSESIGVVIDINDRYGYNTCHDYPNHYVNQQYLPEEIKDARFYEPGDNGHERKIREWMEYIRKGLPDERKKE